MNEQSTRLPFFVYGTLLPGEANFHLWRDAIAWSQPAVLPGACLYDLGNYPMLVEASAGEVQGLVVAINPSFYSAILLLLDQLEGISMTRYGKPLFRRERCIVRLAMGRSVVAWVYVGNNASVVKGLQAIGSDWKAYRREQLTSE